MPRTTRLKTFRPNSRERFFCKWLQRSTGGFGSKFRARRGKSRTNHRDMENGRWVDPGEGGVPMPSFVLPCEVGACMLGSVSSTSMPYARSRFHGCFTGFPWLHGKSLHLERRNHELDGGSSGQVTGIEGHTSSAPESEGTFVGRRWPDDHVWVSHCCWPFRGVILLLSSYSSFC